MLLEKTSLKLTNRGSTRQPRKQHANTMKPTTITITTAHAEQIIKLLETLELDHNNTQAGIVACELMGLIAPDVEAPEPPPTPEELDPVDFELEIPDEIEIEYEPEPEPEPEELDDDALIMAYEIALSEEWAAEQSEQERIEYNEEHPESPKFGNDWTEYRNDRMDAHHDM